MKMLVFSFIAGIVLLYLLNIAILKTPLLDLHWSIHAGIRFLAGFFLLGISFFYAHAMSFKKTAYITGFIVTTDYLYDLYTQTSGFELETLLHGIFMIIWGAILGYLTAKYIKEQLI
ncbi:hypothetical protein [Methylobacter tundripaludum]|uniref:hypothetical protein n=1 Tax=Methylobacter tundripaludum TaxID=173365 RepID=UPI0004DFB922|nr:hypothetical protein [Methylobacter tundripaludum]